MPAEIIHDQPNRRFITTIEGHLAEATYLEQGHNWVMNHTYVPDALRGQGVAAQLVETALAAARESGIKIVPACSYVARYMERHPETADLRA